mmetsp:Transcript_14069/g.21939  ORF Transcript_14069/g.21939 Transcript_14069/m.21939 type:complete len:82 (-) Transcript_14069:84-329(-)
MITNFFTEYHYPASMKTERDLWKLSILYVKGRFIWDFLAILPLFHIFSSIVPGKYLRLAYVIKILRIVHGFEQLDRKRYMK